MNNLPGLLGLLFENPLLFVIVAGVLLLSLTFHEFAHAYTAYKLGDPTPKQMDRVNLNPLKHLDPLGTIMLLVAGFGFAKPVPINPYRVGRWGMFWAVAAGPLSNLLIALVCGLIMKVLPREVLVETNVAGQAQLSFVGLALITILGTNIVLAVFNLIPIPPLDGSRLLGALVPPLKRAFDQFEANPSSFLISMFLVFFVLRQPIGNMLSTVQNWAFSLVF
ncbi:site-2 protease family protein [Deinococcus cavernae]|uniref:Site-2 protease family protein n=1 Tax=Deinococcus cavernae TaxID=2320857 RepID=A0A418V6Y0_9DEIO|nr:site-2 protease family protein [Deinococcus cavernae]RJF71832.1 site-2 protease family protein [Deinococcus cavernae]